MSSTKKMAALGLGGGVALASAAFAIGSQVGGGSAVAGPSPSSSEPGAPAFQRIHGRGERRFGGGPGPRLESFATKLGVSEEKLREALRDLRPERKDRDEHLAELAKILKLDEAKVRAALGKARPARPMGPPAAFVEGLAKALGISEAKVRTALENMRDKRPERGALAKELGVSEEKLREALQTLRPRLGRGRGHHRGGPGGPGMAFGAEVAKELGVSVETLQNAFRTLREQKQAEFAKQLAEKLSISPEKVEEVLRDMPHPRRRGR